MSGATRFMTLLTTPISPLRPSLHLICRRLSTKTPLTHSSPSKLKNRSPQQLVSCFHSQPNNNSNNDSNTYSVDSNSSHPWPEWTNFLNFLPNAPEDSALLPEDAFVAYERLPDHFVRAAASCLAFARARPDLIRSVQIAFHFLLLSRKDIEVVVSTGTPFLFRGAIDITRRMGAFLASDASEVQNASTVDLMKYIVSYASNPTVSSEGNGLYSRELVDSSVCNLLSEVVIVSFGAPASYVPATGDKLSGRPRQIAGSVRQNIGMKRGDWTCAKCNFMNFARNVHCRECNKLRPRKQLTGGEWECPQCNFCNYGANLACLRCDCRRAGAPLFPTMNSSSGSGDNADLPYKAIQTDGTRFSPQLSEPGASDFQSRQDNDFNQVSFAPLPTRTLSWGDQSAEPNNRNGVSLSGNQTASSESQNLHSSSETDKEKELVGKSENWLGKPAELHDVNDLPSVVTDEEFLETMPVREGENRFVVTKKKDRSLTSPKYKSQVAMDHANNTNFVPFVPFPPGYFAKKDEQPSVPNTSVKAEPSETAVSSKDYKPVSRVDSSTRPKNDSQPVSSTNSHVQMSSTSHDIQSDTETPISYGKESTYNNSNIASSPHLPENESFRSSWVGPSLEGSAVKEMNPFDLSEEAKAERWFKRVAKIKDISELSQIPDEDFPSIMPMRKGVNRFVVSKRKNPLERRLTNQTVQKKSSNCHY